MCLIFFAMKTIAEKPYHQLIQWLIDQRKAKGITQEELSDSLGLPSHSYLSKVESVQRKLDVVEYFKICRELDIDYREGMELLHKLRSNSIN